MSEPMVDNLYRRVVELERHFSELKYHIPQPTGHPASPAELKLPTQEWLDKRVAADPDNAEREAGASHPEASGIAQGSPDGWRPSCDRCNRLLSAPGALLFGPPNNDGRARKTHVCVDCFEELWTMYGFTGDRDAAPQPPQPEPWTTEQYAMVGRGVLSLVRSILGFSIQTARKTGHAELGRALVTHVQRIKALYPQASGAIGPTGAPTADGLAPSQGVARPEEGPRQLDEGALDAAAKAFWSAYNDPKRDAISEAVLAYLNAVDG